MLHWKTSNRNEYVTQRWPLVFGCLLFVVGCESKQQEPASSFAQTGEVSAEKVSAEKVSAEKVSRVDARTFREAALAGHADIVQHALDAGMDVDQVDEGGRTALLLAAFDGHLQVVNLLIQRGANVNHRDAVGRTALMYASTGPSPEVVRQLLSAGADPNLADNSEGFTALMFAAAEGQLGVVEVLLEHNADISLRDVDGDTALGFATQNGHRAIVDRLKRVDDRE